MTVQDLPALNATLNTICAALLIAGYWAVKRQRIGLHKLCVLGAVAVSVGFLTSYLIYHYHAGSRSFTGSGWIRPVYFTLLISHIILAIVEVPLIIASVILGLLDRISQHRKIAPATWWIWLYVSITGVLVYLMLY